MIHPYAIHQNCLFTPDHCITEVIGVGSRYRRGIEPDLDDKDTSNVAATSPLRVTGVRAGLLSAEALSEIDPGATTVRADVLRRAINLASAEIRSSRPAAPSVKYGFKHPTRGPLGLFMPSVNPVTGRPGFCEYDSDEPLVVLGGRGVGKSALFALLADESATEAGTKEATYSPHGEPNAASVNKTLSDVLTDITATTTGLTCVDSLKDILDASGEAARGKGLSAAAIFFLSSLCSSLYAMGRTVALPINAALENPVDLGAFARDVPSHTISICHLAPTIGELQAAYIGPHLASYAAFYDRWMPWYVMMGAMCRTLGRSVAFGLIDSRTVDFTSAFNSRLLPVCLVLDSGAFASALKLQGLRPRVYRNLPDYSGVQNAVADAEAALLR